MPTGHTMANVNPTEISYSNQQFTCHLKKANKVDGSLFRDANFWKYLAVMKMCVDDSLIMFVECNSNTNMICSPSWVTFSYTKNDFLPYIDLTLGCSQENRNHVIMGVV